MVSKLDFCHFGAVENAVFSDDSHVTTGFLHDTTFSTEGKRSADAWFSGIFPRVASMKMAKVELSNTVVKAFGLDETRQQRPSREYRPDVRLSIDNFK